MSDPSAGPISVEELKALADAPYGKAAEVLREHDPMFGRAPGEMIEWVVDLRRDVEQTGQVWVKAASKEEAKAAALQQLSDVDWDVFYAGEPDADDARPSR